jgi:uncharacterized membrane protein YphA (DoxX/SURF4 family)
MQRTKIILIWIIGILFILTGTAKLLHLDAMSIEIFERAKYPDWMFYLVGLTELTGGVLVLMVKTRRTGGFLLCGVMFGVVYTHHHLKDAPWHFIVPILLLLSVVWLVGIIKD